MTLISVNQMVRWHQLSEQWVYIFSFFRYYYILNTIGDSV